MAFVVPRMGYMSRLRPNSFTPETSIQFIRGQRNGIKESSQNKKMTPGFGVIFLFTNYVFEK
jgi:hypothetical protein